MYLINLRDGKPQVGDLATGEDLRLINEERAIGGQPPLPDPNAPTPSQQAQQPPVPSSDRTTVTRNPSNQQIIQDARRKAERISTTS